MFYNCSELSAVRLGDCVYKLGEEALLRNDKGWFNSKDLTAKVSGDGEYAEIANSGDNLYIYGEAPQDTLDYIKKNNLYTTTTTTKPKATTTTTTKPKVTTTTTTVSKPAVTMLGDANCDNKVDLADAILIMQALANPNKYGIGGTAQKPVTKQGYANADVDSSTKGLTGDDALRIQEYLLHKTNSIGDQK